MNTLSLNKLLDYLDYSDLRAVRKWCNKNDVFIIKHGKNEFVFETDFKIVWERPFINKLKATFGDDWKSVYQLHKDGNIPALDILHNIPDVKYKTYKPAAKGSENYKKKLEEYAKNKAA
ncbi:MAG: hypothetical protein JWP12_2451 [Bacteroidetes bacterium]|nr:hypothetical protein [Bacteroidota bacterium]